MELGLAHRLQVAQLHYEDIQLTWKTVWTSQ